MVALTLQDEKRESPTNVCEKGEFFYVCGDLLRAALKGKRYGKTIDEHEVVVRLNNAPTIGYENDVGSFTTSTFDQHAIRRRERIRRRNRVDETERNIRWI